MTLTIRTGRLTMPAHVADFYQALAARHNVDAEALMVEALRRIAARGTLPAGAAEALPQRPAPVGPPMPEAARLPRLERDTEPADVDTDEPEPDTTVEAVDIGSAPRSASGRRVRRPFTPDDDMLIRTWSAEGIRDSVIAARLDRHQGAVLRRARMLGIRS